LKREKKKINKNEKKTIAQVASTKNLTGEPTKFVDVVIVAIGQK